MGEDQNGSHCMHPPPSIKKSFKGSFRQITILQRVLPYFTVVCVLIFLKAFAINKLGEEEMLLFAFLLQILMHTTHTRS